MRKLVVFLFLVFISQNLWAGAIVRCSQMSQESILVGSQCETSMGAIFTRIHDNKFGETWRDPSGLVWSDSQLNSHIPYDHQGFDNLPLESDQWGQITKSRATEACSKIKGHLPSESQYMKLVTTYFSVWPVNSGLGLGHLTEEGLADFLTFFYHAGRDWYFVWTSTANSTQSARIFYTIGSGAFGDGDRLRYGSVYCLHR